MSDLSSMLESVRLRASGVGVPVHRRDEQLYGVLSECLAIANHIEKDNLQPEFDRLVRLKIDKRNPELLGKGRGDSNNGKGRRYTYGDTHIMVVRYALGSLEVRNPSHYRYAHAIKQAAEQQVRPDQFVEWIKGIGGIIGLYKEKPFEQATVRAKVLSLERSIEFDPNQEIRLVLKMVRGRVMRVISGP